MVSRTLEYRITARDQSKGVFQSATRNIKATEDRINGVVTGARRLQTVFGALTIGVGAGNSIRELNTLEQQLIRLRGISNNYAGDQQFLAKTSSELSLNLKNLTDNFLAVQQLEALELIKPGQARELTTGFEQAAAKFGVSSAQIELGIVGLRQALTQGTVRAQEFDQIFDAIGAAQPAVARQLGLTTKEFQKLRSANSLVATDLVDALIPALKEFDGAAQARANSLQGSFNRIATSYQTALLAFKEPVGDVFEGLDFGITGVLDGVAANAQLISTVVAGTAATVAAAFGGRAVQSLTNFAAQQKTVIKTSFDHSRALSDNASKSRAASIQTQKLAQISADYTRNLVRQQQVNISATRDIATRTRLMSDLGILQRNAADAERNLATARSASTVATRNFTSAARAATPAAQGLAIASRGLGAAMSLVGGPIGVAAIAIGAAILKITSANRAINDLRGSIESLSNNNYSNAEAQLLEAANARVAAEQKIEELRAKQASFSAGEGFIGKTLQLTGAAGEAVQDLGRQINDIRADLDQLEIQEKLLNDTRLWAEEFENVGTKVSDLRTEVRAISQEQIQSVVDKLLPNESKIEGLKQTRIELQGIKDAIDPARYQQLNSALSEQINKLNGVTEARNRATEAQKRNLKELETLEQSLFTERERLQQQFNETNDGIIRLQVELGTDNVSDAAVADVQLRARERLSAGLDAINTREVEAEKRRIQEVTDARLDKLRDQFDLESALRERRGGSFSEIDNLSALNNRFQVENAAIQQQYDFKLLSEAEFIRESLNLTRNQESQRTRIIETEERAREKARLERQNAVQTVTGLGGGFLELFKRDVGSYIKIQESWTDAEKQRAERSNEINRKAFAANKGAQVAQAVIEGLGATAKAFNGAPWPFNIAAAGLAAAQAAKIVSKIRSTSFGGGGNVSFSGGGGTSGNTGISASAGASASGDNQNTSGGASSVYFITQIPPGLEGAVNQDWLYAQQRRNMKKMIEQDVISSDAEIKVNEVDAPPILQGFGAQGAF